VKTVLLSLSSLAFSTASVLLEALEHAEKLDVTSRTAADRMAGQHLRKCDADGSNIEFVFTLRSIAHMREVDLLQVCVTDLFSPQLRDQTPMLHDPDARARLLRA
jgi:hypothetical protein